MPLFLAFLLVPLIEIALFIQVGGVIGLWWTLLIVIVTAIAGAALVRRQGRGVLGEVQGAFHEFRDPSQPLAEGAMILFSGALLLTPGFFTDAVGFALLVPGIRAAIYKRIRSRMRVVSAEFEQTRRSPSEGQVFEGEYEVEDETTPAPKQDGPSGWTRH